jgi:alpha-beta hydrolase superfamily lysophospholipase
LRLPLLVLVGTADVLTPPAGGRMIVNDAASPDKELRLYDGFYHELINEPEPDRERVMGEIVDWLRARADLVPRP